MLKALPVILTLVTKQEVGAKLRAEVQKELTTVGGQLSVVIAIKGVERFGELVYRKEKM